MQKMASHIRELRKVDTTMLYYMMDEDEAASVDKLARAGEKEEASDEDAKKDRKPSITAVLKYARREVWQNFFNLKVVERFLNPLQLHSSRLPSKQTDMQSIFNIAKTIRYDKKRKEEKKKAWSTFYAEIKRFHSSARALLKMKKELRKNKRKRLTAAEKKELSEKNAAVKKAEKDLSKAHAALDVPGSKHPRQHLQNLKPGMVMEH